jgi:hypothetical protein
MLLKFAIILFLLALVASLGSGFYFLMTDQGDKHKRRTFHALGVRVSLAVTLMGLVVYGLSSGQLQSRAPWDRRPAVVQQSAPDAEAETPSITPPG